MRGAASLATWLLLAVAFAALGVLAIGPHTGRYRTLTVLSGSMSGTFEPGDVIITAPIPIRQLRVGDVITYRIPVDDRRIVTHRVVKVSGTKLNPVVVTKGDANRVRDPWTARLQGQQAWTYRGRIPKAGLLLRSVRGHLVQRASIGALALFAVLTLWGIWTDDGPAEDDAETRRDEDVDLVDEPLEDAA